MSVAFERRMLCVPYDAGSRPIRVWRSLNACCYGQTRWFGRRVGDRQIADCADRQRSCL